MGDGGRGVGDGGRGGMRREEDKVKSGDGCEW